MGDYFIRKVEPSADNKYYISTKYGGYNKCIIIKDNGSVLPNCVGYAWGAWYESLGAEPNLSTGNAENWWDHKDEYKRGQTPKVGAVMCWRSGKTHDGTDGYGHVAIVIEVGDDYIVEAQSAYGGDRWRTRRFKKGSYDYAGMVFQGFIYLPEKDHKEISSEEAITKMAEDVIAGKYGNGVTRVNKLYSTIQGRVNEILRGK